MHEGLNKVWYPIAAPCRGQHGCRGKRGKQPLSARVTVGVTARPTRPAPVVSSLQTHLRPVEGYRFLQKALASHIWHGQWQACRFAHESDT
eukprot:5418184-Pleurochrysis_carterae.AAC.1